MMERSLISLFARYRRLLLWTLGPATIVAFFWFSDDPKFTRPRIESQPFVWPRGCPEKDYGKIFHSTKPPNGELLHKIPCTCVLKSNYFYDWKKNGFPYGRGYRDSGYYRVGDDALKINGEIQGYEYCKVGLVIRGIFVRDTN